VVGGMGGPPRYRLNRQAHAVFIATGEEGLGRLVRELGSTRG
jgi:hypothetical protein